MYVYYVIVLLTRKLQWCSGYELEFQISELSSFPVWGEYNLLFNAEIMNLLLKKIGREIEDLMLLFL